MYLFPESFLILIKDLMRIRIVFKKKCDKNYHDNRC